MQYDTSGIRDSLGEVRDVDEGKRQVLVTIPWEQIDTFHTDFSRDCFDDYLGQRLPAMAWCHQKTEPIGAVVSHSKGQRANEFVAEFSDFNTVPRSAQAFSQIKDGHLKDFSFTYTDAKAVPHPNERGAIRFTKARMPEISPVIAGSIPGAMATGVRSAGDLNIRELLEAQVITAEEARQLLGLNATVPEGFQRESITVGQRSLANEIVEALETVKERKKAAKAGQREDTPVPEPVAEDLIELAGTVDSALTQAASIIDGLDVETLPADVQQALALVGAASVGSGGLLDAMGVPALTDDGGQRQEETTEEVAEGERAAVSDKPWDPKKDDYTDVQWKAACLLDDALPVREPDGTLNKNGVISAAKMIGHVKGASDVDLQAAAKTLMGLLSTVGEKATPSVLALASGKRSEDLDEELLTDETAAAIALLNARVAS